MQRTGTLTITSGFSRLDDTRLMKGALDNGGFARATTFLRQDRQLKNNQTIWVDGPDDVFEGMSVIVITDAGPVVPALVAVGAGAQPIGVAASKSVVRALSSGNKGGKKATSKSKPAKKSAKKSRTWSTKKSSAKKSR